MYESKKKYNYGTGRRKSSGAVLVDANTGNAGLTATGAVVILLLAFVHSQLPPISPGSMRPASGQHGDAQRPCTGADGS